MSTPSHVGITEGNGAKKAASYRISETGVDKEIQRSALNDPLGVDAMGEVTETPAPYTILGRLLALKEAVEAIPGGGGGGGSGTEYVEDAAAAANPTGGMLIARRRDTLTAAEVSADGDNIALNATNKGELRTSDASALTELALIKAAAQATAASTAALENDSNPATVEFDTGSLGGKVGADSLSVTTAKDELRLVSVTLTPDTAVLASGDVIVDSQVVAACMKADDALGILHSFALIDLADQGAAVTIYFLSANVAMGTENSAPSISDANAVNILGWFSIETADYKDVGGAKIAIITNIGMLLKPVTGTDDVYIAIVNGSGTPTYTASSLIARVGVIG